MKNLFLNQTAITKFILNFVFISSSTCLVQNIAFANSYSPQESGTQFAQADSWESQVRRQLNELARIASDGGARQTHEPFIDRLGNGGEDDFNINLRAGTSYIIVGVCDADCTDIDMEIFDDNGRSIARDFAADDTPMLQITPSYSTRFRIRAVMASCSSSPCRFGIGVFGR